MKMQLPNGVTFEEFDDGSIKLTTKHGAELTIDSSGNVAANLATIRNVGLQNLAEVESHAITDAFGSRSHVVKFHGGGVARFAYNNAGKLIELSGTKIGTSLSPEGDVTFFANKKAAP